MHAELEKIEQFEKLNANRIVVGRKLGVSHPLVESTKVAFQSCQRDRHGHLACGELGILTVSVSQAEFGRALRILNAFVKALELRGYQVLGRRSYSQPTCTIIEGEEMRFRVFERLKVVLRDPKPKELPLLAITSSGLSGRIRELHPTGRLALISSDIPGDERHYRWSDRPGRRLEDQLNAFVCALAQAAIERRASRARWEEQRRRQEEIDRESRALELEKKLYRERCEELIAEARQFQTAQEVRDYILGLERSATRNGAILIPESPLAQFFVWGRSVAESLDPAHRRLSLLKDSPISGPQLMPEMKAEMGAGKNR